MPLWEFACSATVKSLYFSQFPNKYLFHIFIEHKVVSQVPIPQLCLFSSRSLETDWDLIWVVKALSLWRQLLRTIGQLGVLSLSTVYLVPSIHYCTTSHLSSSSCNVLSIFLFLLWNITSVAHSLSLAMLILTKYVWAWFIETGC